MSKKVIEATVSDLIPDDKNLNRGTEYGSHLMDKSFRQFGAGRSILLDKNNRIIAGNKSLETFAAVGMDKVRIIETTGDELIAVKRTDVDLDSKQGREMALADNATSKANLDWDNDMMKEVSEEYDINADDWGIVSFDDVNLDDFFEEAQQQAPKDTDITITVKIPQEEADIKDEVINIINEALKDYPNITIA